jgi:hypothetical protein
MNGYWLKFTDGTSGYCEGSNEYDAKQIAEKISGKTVAGGKYDKIEAKRLPYPATPVIWQFDHPVVGKCPPFCFQPNRCSGHTSCPSSHACSE